MIISTSKKIPIPQELSQVLKEEFSDRYSYTIFGLGSEKSVIVRKSTLVGVQITPRKNETMVDGTFPSVATAFFSTLICGGGYWTPLYYSWLDFEKEISLFLKRKYD